MRAEIDDDLDGVVRCDACGEECSTQVVDMGIGAFEYWGAPGFDRQLVRLSSCCEASFTSTDRDEVGS